MTLAKPNPILRLKWSIQFTPVYSTRAVPIMALHIDPQPTPMVPIVVSKLSAPAFHNIAITPIIPTDPLFLPHLWPKDHITWRGHYRSREGNTLYQGRDWDDIYYWITCCMEHTGVKFSIQVGWDLVIDPNPQDMLSGLHRVGSLMWLWWGHLSELIWWS